MNKKEQEALLKRLDELEKFKYKIELGSYWLRCVVYTIGSLVLFVGSVLALFKDWLHVFGK